MSEEQLDSATPIHKGLDGVVIDTSSVSLVDGKNGNIWYAGYHIDDLARDASFCEVLHLLWYHDLPTEAELTSLRSDLAARRELPADVRDAIAAQADADPMDVLRTAVSMLATHNDGSSIEENLQDIVAKMPTIVAHVQRVREGIDPIPPREELSHAANFLYMLDGEEPSEERARAIEEALILYAEHGMNASTLSSVVTTSTLANPYAAITSAIGTLHGPLHGGATETVIETLQEIGSPEGVDEWVEKTLDAGGNIPGFGHRVYEVTDPRCRHFQRQIDALSPEGEVKQWYETAKALQDAVESRLGDEGIHPNTDLYSGIMYRAVGIPPALYTTLFAMGRVAGWSAHILEQRDDNRILRPRVRYEGETGREFTPLDDRD